MKVLLHSIQKNHYIYEGLRDSNSVSNIVTYLPQVVRKGYGDLADSYDSSEFIDSMDEFDLIIFSVKSFYDKNFLKILEHESSSRKIFFDVEDDFLLRNIYKHPNISHYFKRELFTTLPFLYTAKWYVRHIYGSQILPPIHRKIGIPVHLIPSLPYKIAYAQKRGPKLHPFPLTIQPDRRFIRSPDEERDTDLFFCLSLKTISERHAYFNYIEQWLREEKGKIKGNISNGGLTKEAYLEELSNSKAGISVRGMGMDTDRYWETACYGAILFSQHIPLLIDDNFVDGESVVFVKNPDDMRRKFDRLVVKSDEWKEIARKAQKLFLEKHVPEKRLQHSVLDILKE